MHTTSIYFPGLLSSLFPHFFLINLPYVVYSSVRDGVRQAKAQLELNLEGTERIRTRASTGMSARKERSKKVYPINERDWQTGNNGGRESLCLPWHSLFPHHLRGS